MNNLLILLKFRNLLNFRLPLIIISQAFHLLRLKSFREDFLILGLNLKGITSGPTLLFLLPESFLFDKLFGIGQILIDNTIKINPTEAILMTILLYMIIEGYRAVLELWRALIGLK